ncbi:unnamed protein product [Closterium sp. NIES-64]|nr:unnamed protein product [Closterium sp. NIES-64]CAI5993628.1 unnamed protein product [Closterium sp. NIES-65]
MAVSFSSQQAVSLGTLEVSSLGPCYRTSSQGFVSLASRNLATRFSEFRVSVSVPSPSSAPTSSATPGPPAPDFLRLRGATRAASGAQSAQSRSGRHAQVSDSGAKDGREERRKSETAKEPSGSADVGSSDRLILDQQQRRWADVAADMDFLTRTVRLVQWYPGHIAKAERDLKEQLRWVDVVIEVRDARIPLATTHPQLDEWIGGKPKVLVLNREDMVTAGDRKAWAEYFGGQQDVAGFCFTDGQHGSGILKLTRQAMSVSKAINTRRRDKGLRPRAVRAAVVGFPNVGKSAVINRLLNRRVVASAPRPGVTREVKWVRLGEGLDLLDAPGVLPARIADQAAAARLAMCNDIGEAAYAVAGVAAILVELLKRLPTAGAHVLSNRYKIKADSLSGEEFLEALADRLCMGDVNQAAHRVLKDFRRGAFGWIALERPPV